MIKQHFLSIGVTDIRISAWHMLFIFDGTPYVPGKDTFYMNMKKCIITIIIIIISLFNRIYTMGLTNAYTNIIK
jgi:hypothetical protein